MEVRSTDEYFNLDHHRYDRHFHRTLKETYSAIFETANKIVPPGGTMRDLTVVGGV